MRSKTRRLSMRSAWLPLAVVISLIVGCEKAPSGSAAAEGTAAETEAAAAGTQAAGGSKAASAAAVAKVTPPTQASASSGAARSPTPEGEDTTPPHHLCAPSCDRRECGDDGCGKRCGRCEAGRRCEAGKCVASTKARVLEGQVVLMNGKQETLEGATIQRVDPATGALLPATVTSGADGAVKIVSEPQVETIALRVSASGGWTSYFFGLPSDGKGIEFAIIPDELAEPILQSVQPTPKAGLVFGSVGWTPDRGPTQVLACARIAAPSMGARFVEEHVLFFDAEYQPVRASRLAHVHHSNGLFLAHGLPLGPTRLEAWSGAGRVAHADLFTYDDGVTIAPMRAYRNIWANPRLEDCASEGGDGAPRPVNF